VSTAFILQSGQSSRVVAGIFFPMPNKLRNAEKEEKLMPIVQIDFVEGRTVEQKREMAKKVTEAITETLKCPADAVTIVMREATKQNIAKAGILMSDK
jgi:4-oxalocrotonate tautomerase